MNTLLEQLFEKYKISDRDRHEIKQIFRLLPDDKKSNLLANFELLNFKIEKINRDIEIEKDILIGSAVIDIQNTIERVKRRELMLEIEKKIKI